MEEQPELRYQGVSEMKTDMDAVRNTKSHTEAHDSTTDPEEKSKFGRADKRKSFATNIWLSAVLIFLLVISTITIPLIDRSEGLKYNPRNDTKSQSVSDGSRTDMYKPHLSIEFPLKRPTTNCRLVILPVNPASKRVEPEWYRKIENDDISDIVKFFEGSPNAVNCAVIRANGDLAAWGEGHSENSWIKKANKWQDVLAVAGAWTKNSQVVLDEVGKVITIPPGEEYQPIHIPHDLPPVVAITSAQRHLFILTKYGRLHCSGINGDIDVPTEIQSNITSIMSSSPQSPFLSILRRDGRWFKYKPITNSLESWSPNSKVTQLLSESVAVNESRKIISSFWPATGNILNNTDLDWVRTRVKENVLALRRSDGSISIFVGEPSQHFRPETKIEKALRGAVDISFHDSFRDDGNLVPDYIFALLPASLVPKSGLWNIDELVEARGNK